MAPKDKTVCQNRTSQKCLSCLCVNVSKKGWQMLRWRKNNARAGGTGVMLKESIRLTRAWGWGGWWWPEQGQELGGGPGQAERTLSRRYDPRGTTTSGFLHAWATELKTRSSTWPPSPALLSPQCSMQRGNWRPETGEQRCLEGSRGVFPKCLLISVLLVLSIPVIESVLYLPTI